MKKGYLILAVLWSVILAAGCEKDQVGYLQTDNAIYVPDTLEIRLVLDEELDAFRMHNLAPWVTPKMQGVMGTAPISYEVLEVTTTQGGNAELFRQLLTIRGGGRMEFPLVSDITPGRYTVSLKITNPGYSDEIRDVFTFIVK